jgi:hypothetical protein
MICRQPSSNIFSRRRGQGSYQSLDEHCAFLLIDFPHNESYKGSDETHKQTNNDAAIPSIDLAAILQRQNVLNDQSHHQSGADEVHLQYLLCQ